MARITVGGKDLRLLKPLTFMNRSGASVRSLAAYLKVPPERVLVAHDELDLPAGANSSEFELYQEAQRYLEAAAKAPDRPGRSLADKGRRGEIADLHDQVLKKLN